MGQCYTVELTLHCKDNRKEFIEKLLNKTAEYLKEPPKIPRNFLCIVGDEKDYNPETEIEQQISKIIPKAEMQDWDEGIYMTADFDACYSWEGYMCDWFKSLQDILHEGDIMRIWPDDGETIVKMEDGQVKEICI